MVADSFANAVNDYLHPDCELIESIVQYQIFVLMFCDGQTFIKTTRH